MKKILLVFICLLLATAQSTLGETARVTSKSYKFDDFTYILDHEGKAVITKYSGYSEDLILPSTLDGYTIVAIGDEAFESCYDLVSVVLPEGLLAIGDMVFSFCDKLSSIVLPDSLISMGANPFKWCSSLASIEISSDHPVFSVLDGVLFNMKDKCLVTYPKTRISNEYKVPFGTKSIGDFSFSSDNELISIILPEGLTSIGEDAFASIIGLTSITLPDSLVSIIGNPFGDSSSLTSFRVSPDHPIFAVISGVLFNKTNKSLITYPTAKKATSYQVPSGIKSIGDSAFVFCDNLVSVTLPDGLISIGDFSFSRCSNLSSVTLPDSLISIGRNPFRYCSSLTTINVSPNHPVFSIIDNVLFNKADKSLVTYPMTKKSESYNVTLKIDFIGDFAISSCESLTSIVLPKGLVTIAEGAFYSSSNLASVVLPEGLVSLGAEAFSMCENLTSIVLPDGVMHIGDEVFSFCSNLDSVTLPASLTSIGNNVFIYCPDTLVLTVPRDSYASKWVEENDLVYQYSDATDWLND